MIINRHFTVKYIITAIAVIIILILSVFFAFRGLVLRKAINLVNARISTHHYSAYWDDARFKGISTVFVRQILVQSKTGNNEAQVDSLSVKIRLTPLIFGNLRLKNVDCGSVLIRYNSVDSIADVKKEVVTDSVNALDFLKGKDFAGIVYNNIRRFIHYVPSRIKFRKIELRYLFKGNVTVCTLHDLTLNKGKMTAYVGLSENRSEVGLPLKGSFEKSSSLLSLSLSHSDTSLLPVPLLRDRYGIAAGFDSLSFKVDFSKRNRHQTSLKGTFSFMGFKLSGQRLASQKILIDQFKSGFVFNIGSNFLEVDSSTVTYLNKIRLKPWLKVETGDILLIHFKILHEIWDAQDFFNSLPQGMFTSLQGIRAAGTLHYFLNFSVDPENPDSLQFETHLTGDNFKIIKYGIDDYRMLNGSFQYQAYDRGRLAASFIVGPQNPDFVTIDNISRFLKASVMTSEDGSFYFHRGFNPGAFRESISANIREGRFARGGSTITMQLVKNVFLTRNKTVARKIEEALIVWLIENKALVSKQRMYEVYLNIIEWGPGIYGINQASRFYFDKRPSDLNLAESIYLASIVPRPKWYKYTFESNGTMRSFYGNYFNRMKLLMVHKQFITPPDTFDVKSGVILTGDASRVFADTTRATNDRIDMEMLPALNYFDRKIVY